MNLPDVFRYRASELTLKKMTIGFVTVQVVSFCLSLSMTAQAWDAPAKTSVAIFWGLQMILLLGYGAIRLVQSIATEKLDRTWDFIRLTPLTSKQVVLGKFLGAPIFAYFLFACLLPWTATYFFLLDSDEKVRFEWVFAISLAGVFALFQLSLLASAYSEMKNRNSSRGLQSIFMMMVILPSASTLIARASANSNTLIFYVFDLEIKAFLLLSFLVFGIWAYLGSCWRVGAELLESPRVWRLPAYLLFLGFYVAGIGSSNSWILSRSGHGDPISSHIPGISALIAVVFFAYGAAFLNSASVDNWKEIFGRGKGMDRFHHLPKWVLALCQWRLRTNN